jgi:hypothetical protein
MLGHEQRWLRARQGYGDALEEAAGRVAPLTLVPGGGVD